MKGAAVKSSQKLGPKVAAWEAVFGTLLDSLRSTLQHCSTLPGADDIEAVHDARVQARRARMALRMVGPDLDCDFDRPALESLLRWLGGMLGSVRDYDVELERLQSERTQLTDAQALDSYEAFLTCSRAAAFEALLTGLKSPTLQHITTLTADLSSSTLERRRPKLAYRKVLRKLARRVTSAQKPLDGNQPPEQWHELRIAVRRLRYAGEALAPATGDRFTTVTKAAVKLQSVLGDMQDTSSGLRFLSDYARQNGSEAQLEAMAELIHLRTQTRDSLSNSASAAARRLGDKIKAAGLS